MRGAVASYMVYCDGKNGCILHVLRGTPVLMSWDWKPFFLTQAAQWRITLIYRNGGGNIWILHMLRGTLLKKEMIPGVPRHWRKESCLVLPWQDSEPRGVGGMERFCPSPSAPRSPPASLPPLLCPDPHPAPAPAALRLRRGLRRWPSPERSPALSILCAPLRHRHRSAELGSATRSGQD